MKSERLSHELIRIRAMLDEPQPELRAAFMAARELLTRGPCLRELAEIKESAIQILERLTIPALHKEREKQLQVSRLIRLVRRAERLDDAELEPLLAEIAPWIEEAADRTGRLEPDPPFAPERMALALQKLSAWEDGEQEEESALKVVLPSSGNPTPANLQWHDLYRRLGRIITTQHRSRAAWARERKALTEAVAILGEDLVEAAALIGRQNNGNASWTHSLSDDLLTRPDTVMETLLDEEQKYWQRVAELEEVLTRNQEVVNRFQNLLRRAENALMDTRDETLIDPLTGLPNRFAFLARLARVMEPPPGEKQPAVPFAVLVVRMDEQEELLRILGRERLNQVIVAMARHMATLHGPEDYLSRWSEECFALLCPGKEAQAALLLANGMHSILSRERYEWADVLIHLRLGCGVVPWSAGATVERLMGVAEQEAKVALEKGSQPVRLAELR
ncbi:MAG: diguanylate cyclase [Magnetococcales bacterium]|nr:diguanylate cyclase [Magnetococcales bacterium]NGZ05765.1 diguanylate cyclase [Magnetococcales bacterium]